MNEYSYPELIDRAINEQTFETMKALYDWMWQYDTHAWNGECFDIGHGLRLFPVYAGNPDDGDDWIIDYEIR